MRILAVKLIIFLILISFMAYYTVMIFRTDYPYLWFIAIVIDVLALLTIPYKKLFKF